MSTELWPWIALAGLGALHGVNPGMGWLFAVALGLQEGKARAVWRALPPLALGHALAITVAVLLAAAVGGLIPLTPLKWATAVVLFVFGVYRLFRHRHPRYGGMRVGPRQLTIWSFLMATAHGAGLMILPIVLAGATPMIGASRPTAASASPRAVGLPAYAPRGGHAAAIGLTPDPGVATAAPGAITGATAAGSAAGHDDRAQGAGPALDGGHRGHAALAAGLPPGVLTGAGVAAVHTLGYLLVAAALAWLVYARLGVRVLRTAWINLDLIWAGALIATAIATPLL